MCEDIIWYLCVPFWLKLFVPAIIVILAVLTTQSIFNRNARTRENRERRLLHIEEMIINTLDVEEISARCYGATTYAQYEKSYLEFTTKVSRTTGLAMLYLKDENIQPIAECFIDIKEMLFNTGAALNRGSLGPNNLANEYSSKFYQIIELLKKEHKAVEKR